MKNRSWALAVLACAATACSYLEAAKGPSAADASRRAPPSPRYEAGSQPLPTVNINGRAPTRYNLHTSGACAKKDCEPILVTVAADCSMDLDPQWLGLDRNVDWFALRYQLSQASAHGAELVAIHEKGSSPSNPDDLFYNQKVTGNGKEIVVVDVRNHFVGVKHSVIEAKLNGKACSPLDPPIIPDY